MRVASIVPSIRLRLIVTVLYWPNPNVRVRQAVPRTVPARSLSWTPDKPEAGSLTSGDGHLVLDRSRLLFTDLRIEQVADDLLRLVLALCRSGDDFVISRLHAVELQLARRAHHLRSLHVRIS